MTRLGQCLVSILSRALTPTERDVVLGDIAESGENFLPAVRDLLGLIVRRQAGLWTEWRPWLALLGIGGLAAVPLSREAFSLNVALGQQIMALHRYGVRFETGVSPDQDLVFLVCLTVALFVWSWTCGFALCSLSGRGAWLTWPVFYVVALNSAWARFVLAGNIALRNPHAIRLLIEVATPRGAASLLVVIGALCGALIGVRQRALSMRSACRLAFAIVIVTIAATWTSGWYEAAHESWSGGVWHGEAWPIRLLPFVLIGWPAAYLLATATWQSTKQEKPT